MEEEVDTTTLPPLASSSEDQTTLFLPRLLLLFLLGCFLVAPEALRLPHLYFGKLHAHVYTRPRPDAARGPPPLASKYFHPLRGDCEPSWDLSGPEPPFCYTYLQCALYRLGMNHSHGFFIEAGAYDGIQTSHSLMFEQHMCWKGLLVEPSERFFGGAFKHGGSGGGPASRPHSRFVHGAVVDSAHNGVELLAGIDNEPTNSVPAEENAQAMIGAVKPEAKKIVGYSIAHLLRELGVGWRGVDFFSLDIESWEMQALNGLEEYRPTLMAIEVWDFNGATPNNREAVFQKMADLGYTRIGKEIDSGIFSDVFWQYSDA